MENERQEKLYVLLDSGNIPLARGRLESPQNAPEWMVRLEDEEKVSTVMQHEQVRMVPLSSGGATLLGRILRSRNDCIILKKLQELDSDMRQNFRMPTPFSSFIYPLSGRWRGRREIRGNDLSCGGISFFSAYELGEKERMEVVIPITSEPVIVQCEILRKRPSEQEDTLYAAKFINLCDDEEMVIREAVFSVQVNNRPRSAET